MIKTAYALLALALSFLIVGPVHSFYWMADDDGDNISNRDDICPQDTYRRSNYHGDCLTAAGLKIPTDADFVEAQDRLNNLVYRITAPFPIGPIPFASEDRTYEQLKIKTCSILPGGLRFYKLEMDVAVGVHEVMAINAELGSILFPVLLAAQRQIKLAWDLHLFMRGVARLHRSYADTYQTYADSAKDVIENSELCTGANRW